MVKWGKNRIVVDGEQIDGTDLMLYLYHPLYISNGVKIKDLFRILSMSTFWEGIFLNEYLYEYIKLYKSYKRKSKNPWVTSVTFNWVAEQIEGEFSLYLSIYGKKQGSSDPRSLCLCDMKSIMEASVKIDPSVSMRQWRSKGKWVDVNIGTKQPTVFETFKAFVDEITFDGGPQDRIQEFNKLIQEFNKLKEIANSDPTDLEDWQ